MSEVKITVLIDDLNGTIKNFILSYGFAALIELDNKKILFDAGTNIDPLLKNLKTYGILPSELDGIILSHNHYDHTDGVPGILRENPKIPIYVHKDWDRATSFKGFQIPFENKKIILGETQLNELSPFIYLTNSHYSPDYGGIYEHAAYIKAEKSFILLCGCCHPGLIQFLEDRRVLGIANDIPLHIMGGMHGFKFSEIDARRMDSTIKSITLFHCTMNANKFKEQFDDKCHIGVVGKTLNF